MKTPWVGLTALSLLAPGCLHAPPQSPGPASWCESSQRLLAIASPGVYVEIGVEAVLERRSERPLAFIPESWSGESPILVVGPRIDQIMLGDTFALDPAASAKEDCGFVQLDGGVAPVDTIEPSEPGSVEFSRVRSDGSGVVTTRFYPGRNAHGPGARSYLVQRRRSDGFVDLVEASGTTEAVLLSSGAIVVRRGSHQRSVLLREETTGPFRSRIVGLAGWGEDRIWGVSRRKKWVIGVDPTGAKFFRQRVRGTVSAVMPHRDGVCVGLERGDVRCFDLHGSTTVKLEVPGAQSFAVDADGQIYVASASAVSAFAADGALRWRDEMSEVLSNMVLSPVHGLCVVHSTAQPTLVCYGLDSEPAGISSVRASSGPSASTKSVQASQSASVEGSTSGTRQSR